MLLPHHFSSSKLARAAPSCATRGPVTARGGVPGSMESSTTLSAFDWSFLFHAEFRDEATGWARWGPLLVNVTPLVLIFVLVIVAMSAGPVNPRVARA